MSGQRPERSLSERLHGEAMAERPAFSDDMHGRIMRRIRSPAVQQGARVWRLAIAAAVLLAGAAGTVFYLAGFGHRSSAHISTRGEARPALAAIAQPVIVNINGVISATFQPADDTLKWTIANQDDPHPAAQDNASPTLASPEWLFACLEQPVSERTN